MACFVCYFQSFHQVRVLWKKVKMPLRAALMASQLCRAFSTNGGVPVQNEDDDEYADEYDE